MKSKSLQSLLQSLFIHECKTPISNNIAYLDMLLQGDFGVLTDEQISAIKILEHENATFLHYLKTYQGLLLQSPTHDTQNNTLNSICKQVIQDLGSLLHLYPHQIETHYACPETVIVKGNFMYFSIHALLQNAILYSPIQERIDIKTAIVEDTIHFSIKSFGTTFTEEDIAHIFTRGYRSKFTHEKYPEGSGMGLYLIHSILELVGGTISCSSEEHGIVFHIALSLEQLQELSHVS